MSVSSLYLISLLIAIAVVVVSVITRKKELESTFIFLFFCMVAVHAGYYALSTSQNLQEAILAYKITYMDGTIVPYVLFLAILHICGIHNYKVAYYFSILPVAAFLLGMTAGQSDIYYKDIELIQTNGYSYLERGHGPLHFIGTLCIVLIMAASIGVVVYALLNRNRVSYKYAAYCAVIISVNVIFYFLNDALGLDFEILPFQYNVTELLMLYVINRMRMHEIGFEAYVTKHRLREYGYLAFDKNENYLGCDEVAKYYFPEVEELALDAKITSGFIKDEFVIWKNYEYDGDVAYKHYKRCGRDIRCSRKRMINDHSGEFEGYLVEIQDDTENVQHLNTLRQMNESLTEAVESAKQANLSKSIFLSRMSHEIRTPINAVIGMDEAILRESKNKTIRNYARTIESSSRMLLMIVNELLDFSKIESGKMELVEEEYDQEGQIFSILEMVKRRAINKDLELRFEQDGKLPARLYGDHLKVQEIVINLLTNAIKYTDSGSVTLKVSAVDLEDDITELHYSIIDTGIGISEEDIEHLFEAFTRTNLKRNYVVEGTGLGLSISNSYAQLLGGHIEVKSTLGEGSVFTAILPQKKASTDVIEAISIEELGYNDEENEEDVQILSTKDTNIVVVDDNKTNLEVFKLLLKPTNVSITALTSGKDLISLLEGEHEAYDMVFLDHMMPELDGLETLKIIHERNIVPDDFPIIALTANAITTARDFYLSLGFTDYLSKPIDVKLLEQMITKYLDKDKYEYKTIGTDSDEISHLPELEEFDFAQAVKALGSADIVKTVAQEVCSSLPMRKESLVVLFHMASDPNALDQYRIEVHSIKSDMASVGAILLSKLCRVAEVAATEGDLKKLSLVHPIIIDEMDKHYDRLLSMQENEEHTLQKESSDEAELKPISEEELKEKLLTIKAALEDWDYDVAEEVLAELEQYEIPLDMAEGLLEVKTEVHNVNASYAVEAIDSMLM